MTTFQSLRLIYEIYYKKGLPDLDLIQSYGLLAIKVGQLHALRLDFLSAEKCNHLAKLYRSANPIAQEDVDELIRAQGGQAFRENFISIDSSPLATASVGQVYKARLRDGSDVVIKVIKARFKERFLLDVQKLRRFFKLILTFFPRLNGVGNPLGILDDIEEYTVAELDLRNEAKGRRVLEEIFKKYETIFDLSMLTFNKVHSDLSSENIMVSDFIPAPSVDELLSNGRFSYADMLKLFYLQGFYIFIAGKFHGDIHPGNVLYDGNKFFFVDTAFVGSVSDRIRRNLFFFFEALSRYDYRDCAKFLNEMADQRLSGINLDTFSSNIQELYKDFKGKTVTEVSLTRQMMQTIKLGVNSGMKFEKGIFSIIRSLMYLDGMVLKCNPNAVLMDDMRAFVAKYQEVI